MKKILLFGGAIDAHIVIAVRQRPQSRALRIAARKEVLGAGWRGWSAA